MRKLGGLMIAGGYMAAILAISTDDYYVMELHQYHAMNWRMILIAILIAMIGAMIQNFSRKEKSDQCE
jgi:hypothetical protein